MNNLILKKKGEASFVTYIKKRLKNNLNFVCLFQGALGIGKTYSGMSMAYQLDKEFDAEKQITFDFKETMTLINSDWFKQKKIKIILWDEPQITISNRAWQSELNKLVNYVLSTFRHQNIILIWCAPYQDFLDSQSMKLLHCIFKCKGINKKTNTSRVLPRFQQYNAEMKKTYQHSLYVIEGGGTNKMAYWDIVKPPKHLIDIYEPRKTAFTDSLNKDIQSKLDKLDKKDEQLPRGKPLTIYQDKIIDYWKKGIFNQTKIAKLTGMDQPDISKRIKAMRTKGYYMEEYAKVYAPISLNRARGTI